MGRAVGSLRMRAGVLSFFQQRQGYSQPDCGARPFFRPLRLVCWTGYKEFLAGEGSAGCSPHRCSLPSCPWHSGARAPRRAAAGVPPAPGAGPGCSQRFGANAKHNRPLGELTHRKRRGLMSKLVNFPDDGAEEAEAAHRSPWTPPAHECEPAAATGLSREGHGPSGTSRTIPARRLLPVPPVHPVNTLVLY